MYYFNVVPESPFRESYIYIYISWKKKWEIYPTTPLKSISDKTRRAFIIFVVTLSLFLSLYYFQKNLIENPYSSCVWNILVAKRIKFCNEFGFQLANQIS